MKNTFNVLIFKKINRITMKDSVDYDKFFCLCHGQSARRPLAPVTLVGQT